MNSKLIPCRELADRPIASVVSLRGATVSMLGEVGAPDTTHAGSAPVTLRGISLSRPGWDQAPAQWRAVLATPWRRATAIPTTSDGANMEALDLLPFVNGLRQERGHGGRNATGTLFSRCPVNTVESWSTVLSWRAPSEESFFPAKQSITRMESGTTIGQRILNSGSPHSPQGNALSMWLLGHEKSCTDTTTSRDSHWTGNTGWVAK